MNNRPIRDAERHENELRKMEIQLQAAYQPVRPRPEYIRELHYRLDQRRAAGDARPENRGWGTIFIAAASVVSGTFLIVLGVRGLMALLGRVGPLKERVEGKGIEVIGQAV